MSVNRFALVAASAITVNWVAAGLVIDSFEDAAQGVWPVTLTSESSTSFIEFDLAGTLLGNRFPGVGAQRLDVLGADQVQVNFVPAEGVLDYASSVGAYGTLELWYLGNTGQDIDLSGEKFIRVDFADFDLAAGIPMEVTAILSPGRGPMATLDKWLIVAGPQTLEFPLADFIGIDTVNISGFDSLAINFRPGPGTDFRVDQIVAVVPEPATLCFLAIGGLLAMRRRNHMGSHLKR